MNMETLKGKLENISFSWNDEGKLTGEFAKLAPFFISGGYIKVREDYRVYPTTVEFYFHSEKENGVKDPIVYHRNNNKVEGEIPYFPMFTLHAHNVGYDITFDNPKKQYRASVLIREYQILDVRDKQNMEWLKWDSQKQCFRKEKGQNPRNSQVMYLKYILNGFTLEQGNLIDWIDATVLLDKSNIGSKARKGVDLYEENGQRLKGSPDKRPWSFFRKESIEEII